MILIIDDDKSVCLSLKLLLKRMDYDVEVAYDQAQAMDIIRAVEPRLILMDMNFSFSTSGDEGLILLRQVKLFRPNVPVILMTAWGSIPLAVEGIRAGAFDFITKPWDNNLLLQRIATAIELSSESGASDDSGDVKFDRSRIIGSSPALMKVLDTIKRVARTDASVLITGENGTGKELIAEALHINSHRAGRPFVKVNLGGISQTLFESEMFGHKKGAFTGAVADRKGRFELAHTGTIFLDEIGDLDMSCQVKMLRVLQEHTFEPLGDSRPRKVDVRVVCATNADLPTMVADKTFREDLFYRINLITVQLPPLRERRGDIPLLVRHFAKEISASSRRPMPDITPDAMEFLRKLPYPGNIRELKNLVERTLLVGSDGSFNASHFEEQHRQSLGGGSVVNVDGLTLEGAERRSIENALEKCKGNLSQAAAMLGISRQSLYRRMEKFGIKGGSKL
ncbi:MAG: sigma-54 dependent transcriptional regulator [Muribaculum sp.]|nr:sigma-54 dependent transcriptional regulator [Muribaculum sp.]